MLTIQSFGCTKTEGRSLLNKATISEGFDRLTNVMIFTFLKTKMVVHFKLLLVCGGKENRVRSSSRSSDGLGVMSASGVPELQQGLLLPTRVLSLALGLRPRGRQAQLLCLAAQPTPQGP